MDTCSQAQFNRLEKLNNCCLEWLVFIPRKLLTFWRFEKVWIWGRQPIFQRRVRWVFWYFCWSNPEKTLEFQKILFSSNRIKEGSQKGNQKINFSAVRYWPRGSTLLWMPVGKPEETAEILRGRRPYETSWIIEFGRFWEQEFTLWNFCCFAFEINKFFWSSFSPFRAHASATLFEMITLQSATFFR